MTSAMTRRTALTTLGAGSIAALTACSASLTTANTAGTHDSNGASSANNNSKAKASERSDYSGAVEFNSYDTSAGEYKPATRTSPPQNVPKPIKPENMDEHSVAGLYSAIGFFTTALTYAFVTDPEFIQLTEPGRRDGTGNSFMNLYTLGDPRIKAFVEIGDTPAISTNFYELSNSVASAPKAHILVTGQAYHGGINVYRYHPDKMTLEKIWVAY